MEGVLLDTYLQHNFTQLQEDPGDSGWAYFEALILIFSMQKTVRDIRKDLQQVTIGHIGNISDDSQYSYGCQF